MLLKRVVGPWGTPSDRPWQGEKGRLAGGGPKVAVCLIALALGGCRSDRQPPVAPERDVPPSRADAAPRDQAPSMSPPAGPDGSAATDAGTDDARPATPDLSTNTDVSAPTASDATLKVDGPASDAADPVSPPSAPGCGTERPDVNGAREPDGLAIDTDGTLYYSHVRDGWEILGRIRPGGAAPEPEFARVVRGTTPWGLAIDDTRRRLYFASSGAGTIYVFDLNQPRPAAQVFLSVPTIRPNDLAVGPNGDLYYSDHADNHVYRVDLMGAQRLVTTAPIGDGVQGYRPSALAFGPSGDLFVGMRGWGNIHRLTLTDGLETRRQIFGAFVGWANGLAFDQQGRLYVGLYDNDRTTDVVRLDPTGVAEEVLLSGGRFSSLAFGRGALSCNDLYASDRAGGVRRLTLDAPGLRRP